MTTNLTKTEQTLLGRAAASAHRRGVVIRGWKHGSYGGRESAALAKLVAAGLVRVVSRESYREVRRGCRVDCWTETVYEVVG